LQVTELPFFATKVRLGRHGIDEIYPLGPLSEYERYIYTDFAFCSVTVYFFPPLTYETPFCLLYLFSLISIVLCNRAGLEKAKKELAESIQKGVSFMRK